MERIVEIVRNHYPEVQAIYIFGSYGTEYETSESDIDLAVLFSPEMAKQLNSLIMSDLTTELAIETKKNPDLINLRMVDTVFQKEIIESGKLLYCSDKSEVDMFEVVTISKYQNLNEERKEIIEQAISSGSFYQ